MTIKTRNADPLSTRSLLLSALLGTHPPALPGPALTAFVELFGRPAGTARTALSRMTANGEVETRNGWYHLAGRLLERQREQDAGRRRPTGAWNGSWITVIAASDKRSVAERRAFRSTLTSRRFGELRPDIWMRPDYGFDADGLDDVITTSGPIEGLTSAELTARLWPLDELRQQALDLIADLERQSPSIESGAVDAVPDAFVTSTRIVRFLRGEPQLPTRLEPIDWPTDHLRSAYDTFELSLQATLRTFFADAIQAASGPPSH